MVPSLFTTYCVFTVCFFFSPEYQLFLFRLFLVGLWISCSEESMKALKPGRYSSSTSSIVLALLVRIYNFFGNGTHRQFDKWFKHAHNILTNISLVKIKQKFWKCVCNIQSIIYEKHQESFFSFQLEGSASTNTSLSLVWKDAFSCICCTLILYLHT